MISKKKVDRYIRKAKLAAKTPAEKAMVRYAEEINERRVDDRRDVANEKVWVKAGRKSAALSSHQPLFFHDVPTELIRIVAGRHTAGHKKYIPEITMNLNWREGLHDAHYIMDRYNHLWEHLLAFQDGDESDDHLAAVVWGAGFMAEARRVRPDLVNQVLGQSKYHGQLAAKMKEKLLKEQK